MAQGNINPLNEDGKLFLPGLSGVCSSCGPVLLMDTYYSCSKNLHVYCEFCYGVGLDQTGCQLCKNDPDNKRDPDSPDSDSCCHKDLGCSYVKVDNDLEAYWRHVDGCKYQMFNCPYLRSGCNWTGLLRDMLDHFKADHPENYTFSGSFALNLPFTMDNEESYIRLIRYERELFYYSHRLSLEKENFYACVMMMSEEDDASRFSFQFEIKDPTSNQSIKMVEICHSFCHGYDYVNKFEKCIVLPLKTLKPYVTTGQLKIEVNITKVA